MATKQCAVCKSTTNCKLCTCKTYFCPEHLLINNHEHTKILETKAEQSRIGKSNVRRSKSHERTIAGFLTEWTGSEFRRRRIEGRDVTVIERDSTADIISVKRDIHCSIEAKCGEVQTFGNLMASPMSCKFTEWWHQANYDVHLISNIFNRQFYPMMFFRPYLNQNWVAISKKLFTLKILTKKDNAILCNDDRDVWFPHFSFDAYDYVGEVSFNVIRTKNKDNYKYIPLKLDPVVFCRWQDFAAYVNPASFFVQQSNL